MPEVRTGQVGRGSIADDGQIELLQGVRWGQGGVGQLEEEVGCQRGLGGSGLH